MKVLALVASAAISLSAVGSSKMIHRGPGAKLPLLKPVELADYVTAPTPIFSISSPVGMGKMGLATPIPLDKINAHEYYAMGTSLPSSMLDSSFDWKDGITNVYDTQEGSSGPTGYQYKAAFIKISYSGDSYDNKTVTGRFGGVRSTFTNRNSTAAVNLVNGSDNTKSLNILFLADCKAFKSDGTEGGCDSLDLDNGTGSSTGRVTFRTGGPGYRNFVLGLIPRLLERVYYRDRRAYDPIIPGTYSAPLTITFTIG